MTRGLITPYDYQMDPLPSGKRVMEEEVSYLGMQKAATRARKGRKKGGTAVDAELDTRVATPVKRDSYYAMKKFDNRDDLIAYLGRQKGVDVTTEQLLTLEDDSYRRWTASGWHKYEKRPLMKPGGEMALLVKHGDSVYFIRKRKDYYLVAAIPLDEFRENQFELFGRAMSKGKTYGTRVTASTVYGAYSTACQGQSLSEGQIYVLEVGDKSSAVKRKFEVALVGQRAALREARRRAEDRGDTLHEARTLREMGYDTLTDYLAVMSGATEEIIRQAESIEVKKPGRAGVRVPTGSRKIHQDEADLINEAIRKYTDEKDSSDFLLLFARYAYHSHAAKAPDYIMDCFMYLVHQAYVAGIIDFSDITVIRGRKTYKVEDAGDLSRYARTSEGRRAATEMFQTWENIQFRRAREFPGANEVMKKILDVLADNWLSEAAEGTPWGVEKRKRYRKTGELTDMLREWKRVRNTPEEQNFVRDYFHRPIELDGIAGPQTFLSVFSLLMISRPPIELEREEETRVHGEIKFERKADIGLVSGGGRNTVIERTGELVPPPSVSAVGDLSEILRPEFEYVVPAMVSIQEKKWFQLFRTVERTNYQVLLMPASVPLETDDYNATDLRQRCALVRDGAIYVYKDNETGKLVDPVTAHEDNFEGITEIRIGDARSVVSDIEGVKYTSTQITFIKPEYLPLVRAKIARKDVKFDRSGKKQRVGIKIRIRGSIGTNTTAIPRVFPIYTRESRTVRFRRRE